MKAKQGELKIMTGNSAAAYGAMLCRPDVVASYPITPQTEVVEQLSKFHADGVLDAEMIEVEGENSAMNACAAATLAGGRAFTATSSWGLVYMYDAVLQAALLRCLAPRGGRRDQVAGSTDTTRNVCNSPSPSRMVCWMRR